MMPPYPGFTQFNKPSSQMTQCSGKEMNALGTVIVQVFAATFLNRLASQRIPFQEALLCIKNFVYVHLLAQYWYHTEATIEYMGNYLEELNHHQDVLSQYRASKTAKKVLEASKNQHILEKQEPMKSDPSWNNDSEAARCRPVDVDKMQVESDIALQPVEKSDINLGKIHILNHFSDHIWHLGYLLNISSYLLQNLMVESEQAYRQLNHHDAALQILLMNGRKELFRYPERNAYAAKQCHSDDMPLIKLPIKQIMNNL